MQASEIQQWRLADSIHRKQLLWPLLKLINRSTLTNSTVLPAKSDSDVMFCLQSYQGLIIDKSFVY